MKKCLIVGGGLDGLMAGLMIVMSELKVDLTIRTVNSDPRLDGIQANMFGSTWSSLSARHITYSECYNRNMLCMNNLLLTKEVSAGGWLGKLNFSDAEKVWIDKRIKAQNFSEFNDKLLKFYQTYNAEGVKLWHDLINDNNFLFDNANIKYGIQRNNVKIIATKLHYQEFSLSVRNFAINIINFLERSGVKIDFNNKVRSFGDFHDVIVAVGAYDNHLLSNIGISKIAAVAGAWFVGKSKGSTHNFQLYTDDLCQQNYTYIGNGRYLIGGGYAFVGFDLESLDTQQKQALIQKGISLSADFCTNVNFTGHLCFRAFTYNDIPVVVVKPNNNKDGKIIIIGGTNTGTTTVAPRTGQMVVNILQNRSDNLFDVLNILNEEWDYLIA